MNIIESVKKSDFLKNVAKLTTGTVLAQALAILLSPILSRMYSPEEFGDITLYLSIAGAFAIIATGRYERAIVIAQTNEEARSLVKLSHFVSIGVALFNLILVLIFLMFFNKNIEISNTFKNWLLVMPIFTFLFGSSQAISHWFIRMKLFNPIAISKIINSIGVNIGILILGYFSIGLVGLYLGNFIGLILIAAFLFIYYQLKQIKASQTHTSLRTVAKKYKDFPFTNSPQALVEMFQMNGIIYLLGIFFVSEIVGLYSFSMKVLMAPMWIIGTSISQVFYQKATETFNKGESLKNLYKKTLINSSLLFLPVILIIMLWGPGLFSFIFGKEWIKAGIYAQLLAPWIFFDFIKAPLSQIPIVLGKIKQMFFITIIGNIILIGSMIYGGLYIKDEKISFILLSIFMCMYIIGLLLWIYKISDKK